MLKHLGGCCFCYCASGLKSSLTLDKKDVAESDEDAAHEDAVCLCVATPEEDFSIVRMLSRSWSKHFAVEHMQWMFGDYWISHSYNWSAIKSLSELVDDLKALDEIAAKRSIVVQSESGARTTFASAADAVMQVAKWSEQAHVVDRDSNACWGWGDALGTPLMWSSPKTVREIIEEFREQMSSNPYRPVIVRVQNGAKFNFENMTEAINKLSNTDLRRSYSQSIIRSRSSTMVNSLWKNALMSIDKARDTSSNTSTAAPQVVVHHGAPANRIATSELSGTWQMDPSATEGLESMLEAGDVSYFLRKAALAMAGTFSPKMEITIDGEKFLIVVEGVRGPETMEFVADGPPFKSVFGPQKLAGTGKAFWDGPVLVLNVQMDEQCTETRRWIEEDMLKDKTVLTKGAKVGVMKRAWKRIL